MHLIPIEQAFGLMFGLTPRQEEVLLAIIRFRAAHGYSPSYRQLGRLTGMNSSNAVKEMLDRLVRKDALRCDSYTARSLVPRAKWIPAQELFADVQA